MLTGEEGGVQKGAKKVCGQACASGRDVTDNPLSSGPALAMTEANAVLSSIGGGETNVRRVNGAGEGSSSLIARAC